jgi:hypothetical protein
MYDSSFFVLQASQSSQAPSMQVGRISHSWCTSRVAGTASGRILAVFGSRLLASTPIVISRSAWRPSYPTDGSELLVTAATVGVSTWRAGVVTLWIASVEDNAASTYDFHATHGKTNMIM